MVNFYGTMALAGYVNQPAGGIVRLPQARTMATGTGIVAVIDTGVDPNHPLLRGALVNGYDFTRNVPGADEMADLDSTASGILSQEAGLFLEHLRPTAVSEYATAIVSQEAGLFLEGSRPPSGFGHGTMVAGIIRLAAPTARIMPLKAFTAAGTASLFDLTRAVYYAAGNGASVINMSFTLTQPSEVFTGAINYAAARGAISVGAAGNQGRETIVFPAGYHNVLGVASTNDSDTRSTFTNFGAALVSLAGPGEGLVTAYPGGGYATVWGTSFSAPLVSGTISLMLQTRPGSTYSQIEQALQAARRLGPELGAGRLDAAAAVAARLAQP
jgi:subtilisin family serine protease